jgi:hypothetical protein
MVKKSTNISRSRLGNVVELDDSDHRSTLITLLSAIKSGAFNQAQLVCVVGDERTRNQSLNFKVLRESISEYAIQQ